MIYPVGDSPKPGRRAYGVSPQRSSFGLSPGPADARWHSRAGARRAGARRRTAKTGRWLRPIRLGIGASNCATRSAPSSNFCAEPSRNCARNSIRRTRRSEAADSAIRTQARHSGSSPKPGHGAAVAFGRRCENVSCGRSQRTGCGGARSAARRVGWFLANYDKYGQTRRAIRPSFLPLACISSINTGTCSGCK
jgi:hypothetical protein